MDSFEALSLDNNFRNSHIPPANLQYSRSKSNLEQIYDNNKIATVGKAQEEREAFLPNINKTAINSQAPLKKRIGVSRQTSCQEDRMAPKNNFNIRQSLSDVNLTKNNNKNPRREVVKNDVQNAPRGIPRRNSFSKVTSSIFYEDTRMQIRQEYTRLGGIIKLV